MCSVQIKIYYLYVLLKVTQSCPTLYNPMDCTVYGIAQARILQWVAFPFSRGSSQPRDDLSHSLPSQAFPGSSAGKESACNAGDPSSILESWRFPWRRHRLPTPVFLGFPGGSTGKESACSVEDLGSIPGLGRFPRRRERLPTAVFWPGEFHGLYSSWGGKEMDTTERLSFHKT